VSEVYLQISRILWEDWDPIGVHGIAPDDEYDSYALELTAMLNAGASELEVSKYLKRMALEHMGLDHAGNHAEIARIIMFAIGERF
jgi:hypothetical protein